MIVDLETWRSEPCAGGVVLVGPSGEQLRVRPHVRPAPEPGALLEEVAFTTGARIRERGSPVELSTQEGEVAHIAWASLTSGTCAVAVAVVAGVMCIDAVAPDARALVERLARELGAGLGERRRRPFRYDPPATWRRIDQLGSTAWCHPERASVATVFFARPFTASANERLHRALFAQLPAGFHTTHVSPHEDMTSLSGLVGRLRIETGHRRGVKATRIAASFGDDRFLYLAHFEGDPRDVETFRSLLATFQPVPCIAVGVWHE
ncbi:MAG: hypothetical protein AB7T06_39220 [Kofleriaceae bacterium]